MKENTLKTVVATIGVDLGDKHSRVCVLDQAGEIVEESRIATTAAALTRKFKSLEPHRVVIETGTHANWVHDVLVSAGHEVIVANARKVHAISANERKCDELDARILAQLGRSDVRLLHPVTVRPAQIREDMCLIRSREALVTARTELVNSARGLAKSMGARLPSSSTNSLHKKSIDPNVERVLKALFAGIEELTKCIKESEKQIKELSKTRYPQIALVQQVHGVGAITAPYFVLTIGEPSRFENSRAVGAFYGLVPRRDQSGGRDPELGITKCGDVLGRKLLVQCAQFILGPFGQDSDLRRFGLKLAAQGGKGAKKRAVVATARKLAVLLFTLLRSSEEYEPLRNSTKNEAKITTAAEALPSISRPSRTQAS